MDAQDSGFVVWFTGMHRSGKTTLAKYVATRLGAAGRRVELLDEDAEAKVLVQGLGGGKDDHALGTARLGLAARGIARAGGVAVVAALSPYRDPRDQVRRDVRRFLEVFTDCALEKLVERDREGTYKKAMAGEATGVAGIDLPYEPPTHAECVLHTEQEGVDACGLRIFQAMVDNQLVGPTEFGRLTGGLRPKRGKPAKAARGKARGAARKAPRKAATRAARKRGR